jgi:hypothetical protein
MKCDRCGTDVGAGGLDTCIIVSDLSAETGVVVNMHFCRENRCATKVLSKDNVRWREDVAKDPRTQARPVN